MSITSEFLRHPVLTGAIAASSPQLAEAITSDLGIERADRVVELGPGTGVFTEAIVRKLRADARLTAVEINPRLADTLSARFPEVDVVTGSAEDLEGPPADVVVSGLPWTAMRPETQTAILDAVTTTLTPDGRFTTFAYIHTSWTPPARRFASLLSTRFSVVVRTPVIWRNLPPAFVYRAALPRVVGEVGRRAA